MRLKNYALLTLKNSAGTLPDNTPIEYRKIPPFDPHKLRTLPALFRNTGSTNRGKFSGVSAVTSAVEQEKGRENLGTLSRKGVEKVEFSPVSSRRTVEKVAFSYRSAEIQATGRGFPLGFPSSSWGTFGKSALSPASVFHLVGYPRQFVQNWGVLGVFRFKRVNCARFRLSLKIGAFLRVSLGSLLLRFFFRLPSVRAFAPALALCPLGSALGWCFYLGLFLITPTACAPLRGCATDWHILRNI